MKFWGKEVKPGMAAYCKEVKGFVLHVSQSALGETQNRSENVVVSVKAAGAEKVIIGTLSADMHPQFSQNEDAELETGKKPVKENITDAKLETDKSPLEKNVTAEDEEQETGEHLMKKNVPGSFTSPVDRRQHANSMVVKICSAMPSPTEKDPNHQSISHGTGIILVAESDFCYIMFKRDFIEKAKYFAIQLPDESNVVISKSRFCMPPKCSDRGLLAGCFVYQTDITYDLKKIKAVEFGGVVQRFDEVYLCDASAKTRLLVPGFVR